MPTHLLDGTTPVRLPRGPLAVQVRTTGSPARLDAHGETETPVLRPASHLVILPRLTGPVVLRVTPSADAVFGPGSSVALALGIEGSRADDPEQAQLPAIDLTGLPHRDLLLVEPREDGLWVRVTAPIDDETLPGLLGLARAATRRVLGVDRVPPRDAVRLVVSLDASASGRVLASSGATAAVTQVLLGMSRVLASEPPRFAVVAGDDLTWVPPTTDLPGMAHACVEAVVAAPPTIGFRAAHPELRAAAGEHDVVTCVVTDGVPADIADLAARGPADGAGPHLVVVGDAAPSPEETGAVSTTNVRAVDGEPLADRLSRSPAALDAVVRDLLRGCLHPDSAFAARTLSSRTPS
jgi:hypothetical protein